MTPRRPTPTKASISWQYVVLTAIGCAFFLGIFVVIPDDQPQLRTGLLGVLILAGQAAVTHFLGGRLKEVKSQVNGRMTELISSLEKANETIKELHTEADVSRETSAAAAKAPAKRAPRKRAP